MPASAQGELIPGFEAENDLEARLFADPEIETGLAWGAPRKGHPEGSVGNHVADLLIQIDVWGESGERRDKLRLVALVHDSLKHRERDWIPHAGRNHHGLRARKLAEGYVDDEGVLATLELHDRPYALWRRHKLLRITPQRELDALIARLPDRELFMRFVELDASTDGKNPEPVEWFRRELDARTAATGR